QFQTNHAHTVAICQELERLEMFQGLKAQVRLPSGRKYNFIGAQIIDEKKLSAIADADFLEWRRRGWLALIYAHLISLGQMTRLAELHEKSGDGGEPGAASAAATE
ncbi:MAG: SapC family protein, partial [Proteobacteria bacterium]|nr:SapC family protein [Pseudomonadota bacterium]